VHPAGGATRTDDEFKKTAREREARKVRAAAASGGRSSTQGPHCKQASSENYEDSSNITN
jgi:hypothetical protein